MPVHNAEVAAMFDQTADLLDIVGENPFRVRAYRHAARVIEALPQSIANMLAAGRDLSELPGIGKDLAGKIADIVKTGRFKLLDAMKRRLPGELGEIAALLGLGPNFGLGRDAQTKRIIRAMDNPHVSIIAHPTGRLIGEREPYQVDIDLMIAAARDRGCCLEINAGPDRLDLNDLNARAAKSAGARAAISSDAHAPTALDWMRYGVDQARRGWLEPQDVINTRPLTALKKLLKR